MSPFDTIPEALFATAERDAGEYVFHLDEGPVSMSCAELAERAQQGARRLLALGVQPGDPVGVLGPNRPEWIVSAFSVWVAGAVVVPVQIPLRVRDPAAFRAQLRGLVGTASCRRVLVHQRFADLLFSEVAVLWDGEGEESDEEPLGPAPVDTAVTQFTSGSTSAPRGALIRHSAAIAQTAVLEDMVCDATVPRTFVSWVPFFHDMGLFLSVLAPAVWGGVGHYLPTERFARDPVEWLRLVEASRAALTLGPPAAFGSTLRAWTRSGEHIDLSSLESALLVAEPIDPEVAQRLVESAPRLGLRVDALGGGYGLAEAVLAVAYSSAGHGLTLDRVDFDKFAGSGVAAPAGGGRARTNASSGIPRVDLRVLGPDGELPERCVGEIVLRGPSLMGGYVGRPGDDPFVDGWLQTGDFGYLADGELFVTGRSKDMVIAMGHNYYPEDFEWAAARVDGVRPGRCVAFSLPDTEKAIVLVETDNSEAPERLGSEVKNAIADAVGVAPAEVVVLPTGAIKKTTSGKLRRAAMREAYATDALNGAVSVRG